ncbi:SEC-C metal-binding domain-containing protein [Pseudomonas sp. RtIB026]|uniref:SEC-C metal-binding domain-containing protein n=1 Tax=Pseudomonas sp. RtIB026 TaxID=2749999 RepID=UPI0019407816|nr:SEC-C metal-binding domain-containing protein [Pseudomonas sp. RtIB026]
MLKPTIKEIGVNESERILERVAQKTFLSLWSYPSLYRDVGGGKELIDLTVYFGDTVILFSDKGEVKYQHQNEIKLAWSRWYRAAVKESAKQLYAAESFLKRHPGRVYLNKECKDKFPFDLSGKQVKVHLIAVTRGISEHARKYFDQFGQGSRGTLVSYYKLSEQQVSGIPFTVTDVDPKKTFVHVLDEEGLELLLRELPTPTDFINYLESKEFAIRQGGLTSTMGEEELLGYYLLSEGKFGFGAIHNLSGEEFGIGEHQWKMYRESVPYALHYGRRKNSEGCNAILTRFSDCIIEGDVGEGMHQPLLTHAQALHSLANENLYSRSHLSKYLFEKYESVPVGGRSARVVPSLCHNNKIFIFVFFPWDDNYENYQAYRDDRLACMHAYALVAQYKMPKTEQIVVFGAMTKGSGGQSETIIVVDAKIPLGAEERVLAAKFMKEDDILNDVTFTSFCPDGVAPKIGRNEKCPCGSSRKFKVCCMQ